MSNSHADNHDRDKLSRWCEGLAVGTARVFPAYAVFLVTPEDRYAHDVFREFRSSFENLGAEYEHLVIFGQHGVSTTLLGLLDKLGHSLESLPLLALFSGPPASTFHSLALMRGPNPEKSQEDQIESGPDNDTLWRAVLSHLEDAAGGEALTLDVESLPGVESSLLTSETMEKLVGEVLERVSSA